MNNSAPHESAAQHVQGLAAYIDDLPLTEGTLHAAPILSNVANGRILSLDLSAVLAAPGVHAVITTDDIPGDKLLATFVHDEPVFATGRVEHVGQVLGLVVAESHIQARAAAQLMVLKVQAEPPVLTARPVMTKVLPTVHVQRGEAAQEPRPVSVQAHVAQRRRVGQGVNALGKSIPPPGDRCAAEVHCQSGGIGDHFDHIGVRKVRNLMDGVCGGAHRGNRVGFQQACNCGHQRGVNQGLIPLHIDHNIVIRQTQ